MIVHNAVRQGQDSGVVLSDSVHQGGTKWTDKKRLNQKLHEAISRFADALLLGLSKYGYELSICTIRLVIQKRADGSTSFRPFSTCKRRWCPVCSWRASVKNWLNAIRNFPRIQREYPAARYGFFTFTVPNCSPDELAETVKRMNAAWRRLCQRESFISLGWMKTLEITFKKLPDKESGVEFESCHPHFHAILMRDCRDRWPSGPDWRRLWAESYRIDVDASNVEMRMIPDGDEEELKRAIGQVIKYSIKPMEELPFAEWAIPTIAELKGFRFLSGGGVLKSIFTEPDDLPDESPLVGRPSAFYFDPVEGHFKGELDAP